MKSLLSYLWGKHRAIFSTSSSSWDPVITQYSVFSCCHCATSVVPFVSKGGIYSTGFRRKVGICHLSITDAIKIYSDLEMLWDNCLQVSQLSQASQQGANGRREMGHIHGWGNMLLLEPVGLQSALGREGHAPQPQKRGTWCFWRKERDHGLTPSLCREDFTFLLWTDRIQIKSALGA